MKDNITSVIIIVSHILLQIPPYQACLDDSLVQASGNIHSTVDETYSDHLALKLTLPGFDSKVNRSLSVCMKSAKRPKNNTEDWLYAEVQ